MWVGWILRGEKGANYAWFLLYIAFLTAFILGFLFSLENYHSIFFGVCVGQKCKYSSILLFSPLILLNIRPETPPNTPQRVCIATQQSECDSHVLDSLEH